MKKIYITLIAVLSIIAAFGLNSIRTNAEYDYKRNPYIPKGGEFAYQTFTYRVVKPRTKACPIGEVEITGYNPAPDDESYFEDERPALMSIDDEGVPYKIVGIADYAFKDCTFLRDFWVCGPRIRYVGKGAFEGCTNLRRFENWHSDLTIIKNNAFKDCKSLKRIWLKGNKLKRVGKDAFSNTRYEIKMIANNMEPKQRKKVKRMIKKAGAQKISIKIYDF